MDTSYIPHKGLIKIKKKSKHTIIIFILNMNTEPQHILYENGHIIKISKFSISSQKRRTFNLTNKYICSERKLCYEI